MSLKEFIRPSSQLSTHQKATRRISLFTGMVLLVIILGVLGLYPDNSIELLNPINGLVMFFCIGCIIFSVINLFNKDKIPGTKEFNGKSYFSLLFTLGCGVGIMIYGFNEAPSLSQYSDVRNPIALAVNHWTIVPWCIYVTFTIIEIYDLKYKLIPNWMRTIKMYLYGVMMMLGIGTSFALAVITISSSLQIIYGITIPSYALVILLGTLVTISLYRGIHRGMEVLAKFSVYVFLAFIVIMAILSPADTMSVFATSVRDFFGDFIYNNLPRGTEMQSAWTGFYWIWWISWAAFVAPFIVTISKGRSIRSVVCYTVILPTILQLIYVILGNNIGMDLFKSGVAINMIPYVAIQAHWLLPVIFIILMIMFYVTSSDSQSYAMDEVISKGSKTPIVYRKMLWIFLEIVFVTVLLLAGSGTISAVQGLSFLATPLMILFAIVNIIYIAIFVIKSKKLNKSNNE